MGYGTDSLRQKFSGKECDQETGLDFFGARYYGNTLGHFLTTDLFSGSGRTENSQTWNRYTSVLNCPTGLTDPSGKQEKGRGGATVINVFITFNDIERRVGLGAESRDSIWKNIACTTNGITVNLGR